MSKFLLRLIVMSLIGIIVTACSNQQEVTLTNVNSIPESVIEDLRLSDTSSLLIEDCIDRLTSTSKPTETRKGKVIPSNVILFADFSEDYIDPQEYPVEEICSESGFGIYVSVEQFELPLDADIWTIALDQ